MQFIKEFNLEEALNGKPVLLRNGLKAYVKYNLNSVEPDKRSGSFYPLQGYAINNVIQPVVWSVKGTAGGYMDYEYDIIGMWSNVDKTRVILDKALRGGLEVRHDVLASYHPSFKIISRVGDTFVLENDGWIMKFPQDFNPEVEWYLVQPNSKESGDSLYF